MIEQTTEAIVFYDDDYLFQKRFTGDIVVFEIFDTSRSIFPEGDYQPTQDTSRFKLLGSYQFSLTDEEKFKRFLQSLSRKRILPKKYVDEPVGDTAKNFFVLEKNESKNEKIKNPYNYKFLKLHVSSGGTIAQRKREEFISNLEGKTFYESTNKVYIGDWVHLFLSIDKPYNFDGLKINEVEYDTSIILNCYSSDKNIQNSWDSIKAGLMAVRH